MVFEDSGQNHDDNLVFVIFTSIFTFVGNSALFSRIQVVFSLITIKTLFQINPDYP